MKCIFVYNPISGSGKINKYIDYIRQKLSTRFDEVEIYATKYAGELKIIAENACGVYDYFIFAGGDGSFNEVVNGLKERANKPVLGYIPTGTVNDIARTLKIKRNVKGAIKNILHGKEEKLDVMKINDDHYAMYCCGCGGLTSCSYEAKQEAKKKIGKYAYALEILRNDLAFDEFPVEFSSEHFSFSCDVLHIMALNTRSLSSFRVNPDGVLNDNKFEIVFVKQFKRKLKLTGLRRFKNLMHTIKEFLLGYRLVKKDRNYFVYEGNNVKIKVPDEVVWNFDGEKGINGEIALTIVHENITLIIPKNAKP